MLALLLVLPFAFTVSAAELIGITHGEEDVYTHIFCKGCPEKSIQERFVDDLLIEDAGVVVFWDDAGMPKRIAIQSTTVTPIQDVCTTFLKYWPSRSTVITLHVGYAKTYRCDGSKAGGPSSLEVAGGQEDET